MKTILCTIAAAACAVVLAGCGSDDTATDAGSTPTTAHSPRSGHAPSGTTTTSAAVQPTSSTSTAGTTAAGTTAAGTPECTNEDVKVSYRHEDDATSHRYGFVVLTNTSGAPCWVRGYGGISYAGDDGEQVGAAADRTAGDTPTVTIAPGGTARSELAETSSGPYSAHTCRPAKAVALRVYIPDETDSQLVRHQVTACANPKVHLLEHKPYVAG
ncbi:DUF4232 domain-containing protein [Nocardioides panacisoli]|uniref:DUF4232 domain-containing protein n=1 Tax=Nocardioides panacisoli TaxID=627624 RepID=A0ABP7IBE8_9ACTN